MQIGTMLASGPAQALQQVENLAGTQRGLTPPPRPNYPEIAAVLDSYQGMPSLVDQVFVGLAKQAPFGFRERQAIAALVKQAGAKLRDRTVGMITKQDNALFQIALV